MHYSGRIRTIFKPVMLLWVLISVLYFTGNVQGSEPFQNSQQSTNLRVENKFQTKSIAKSPLFIVVIGDSIAWGSGLLESEKFSNRIAKWLEQSLHGQRQVVRIFCARAGARFGVPVSTDESRLCDNKVHANRQGKVPTIQQQVEMAVNTIRQQYASGPEHVELVLMTGGMSDVGLSTILDANVGVETLRNKTRDIYHSGLSGSDGLLEKTARVFSKAKLVYAGNYKLLSKVSSAEVLMDIFPFHNRAESADELKQIKQRLNDQSTVFFDESSKQVDLAISKLNPSEQSRVKFVLPEFNEVDSLRRKKTGHSTKQLHALYTYNDVYEHDEMLTKRILICKGDIFCDYASVGYPTRVGAAKYAKAIQKEITPFLSVWDSSKQVGLKNDRRVNKAKLMDTQYRE